MVTCPNGGAHAHSDRTPSLELRQGHTQPVAFRCHAGCSKDDVLAAEGLGWADVLYRSDPSSWPRAYAHAHIAALRSFDSPVYMSTFSFVSLRCVLCIRSVRQGRRAWLLDYLEEGIGLGSHEVTLPTGFGENAYRVANDLVALANLRIGNGITHEHLLGGLVSSSTDSTHNDVIGSGSNSWTAVFEDGPLAGVRHTFEVGRAWEYMPLMPDRPAPPGRVDRWWLVVMDEHEPWTRWAEWGLACYRREGRQHDAWHYRLGAPPEPVPRTDLEQRVHDLFAEQAPPDGPRITVLPGRLLAIDAEGGR